MNRLLEVLTAIVCVVCLGACSSNSDKSANSGTTAPNTAVFEKSSGGNWISACSSNSEGHFEQRLSINAGGAGTTSSDFYLDSSCSGSIIRSEGPIPFTYFVESASENTSKVKFTFADSSPVELNVLIQGNMMTVDSGQAKTVFFRAGDSAHSEGPGTPPAGTDFDVVARGSWMTEQCYNGDNNTSARRVLQFFGDGKAETYVKAFSDSACQEAPQDSNHQAFTYTVDRYANGGGQITINGEPSDISFEGSHMTFSSAQGSTVFIKSN